MGQGLAGSTLALRLLSRGKNIIVFDQPQRNRSTLIAAGLFNPVTGKMMTKTWLADQLFNELHTFYSEAEKALESKFLYSQPIYRPFISVEEQNEWMGKSADPVIGNYIEKIFTESAFGHQVNDPYGGMLLKHSGYLDTGVFLQAVRNRLTALHAYAEEDFQEDKLVIERSRVSYKEFTASKIIFCTGVSQIHSSIISNVPVRPLKGETITVELADVPKQIFNRGVFIVPAHEPGNYRVGATYESKLLSESITDTGRKELEEKLSELLRLPYKTVGQDWGIRPTSPDRKPMLGSLQGLESVVIFNGLGTKGVSLAPYFSAQLTHWLLGEGKLQPEVNISRFKSLSSKFSEV